MACAWSSLGAPPSHDEIEVTLMGPGYGESVVVHLGNGEWLIVDSCIDTTHPQRPVAPLHYLKKLGVDIEQAVRLIVVSHWDDDHVRGMAEIVEGCPKADFVCSKVFPSENFTSFVEAMSCGSVKAEGGNVENIRRVLHHLEKFRRPIKGATPGRLLRSHPRIMCWSPSDYEADEFLRGIIKIHPRAGESIRKAISTSPNLTSVVLTIQWDGCSVLLGADMEKNTDPRRGWAAITTETTKLSIPLSELVKIPHHGSSTGDDSRMWEMMVKGKPISILAPFGKGPVNSRAPTPSDVNRIRKKSEALYITTRHRVSERARMDLAVERCIREGSILLTSQKIPIGIIRHRRKPGSDWRYELFGGAFKVK